MKTPTTTNPHLASIGLSLGRSMERNIINNRDVISAFAVLAAEVDTARQSGSGLAPFLLHSN